MDEQADFILYAVEIVVGLVLAVYGGTLVWLIRRLLNLEDVQAAENAEINTSLAVLSKSHEELKEETRRTDRRNEIAHDNIEKKLDAHNDRVMSRMDSMMKFLRNGSN